MEVTTTFKAADRAAWRAWLVQHHRSASEIWLVLDDRPDVPTVTYLDAVEEGLCFGWIDSTKKRISPNERAQRFSPRRPRSQWTELNKARARRLIELGLMTDAGRATLPDLDAPFTVPADIVDALKAKPGAWENFQAFPDLYQRVRINSIEDVRKTRDDFERRLHKFVDKTAQNQMFGDWNDRGRLE